MVIDCFFLLVVEFKINGLKQNYSQCNYSPRRHEVHEAKIKNEIESANGRDFSPDF